MKSDKGGEGGDCKLHSRRSACDVGLTHAAQARALARLFESSKGLLRLKGVWGKTVNGVERTEINYTVVMLNNDREMMRRLIFCAALLPF